MYGRLTTLNRLREARSDYSKHPYRRMQADKAIRKIVAQLQDRQLMRLRERLIRATLYGDQHEQWKLENQIRAHEKSREAIETKEYTPRDEDE